ncbi:hypothetical protein D3C81_703990 [compost metagenome]
MRGQHRIGIAVRAFRVHVDQAHLHGGQRVFQFARMHVAISVVIGHQHAVVLFHALRAVLVTHIAAEPGGLAAPVHVLVRLPGIGTAAGKAERLEAHRFQCDVAGQDQQVGPGNGLAILLLDRPQQASRLVQADVVRPAVERREALLAAATATTAIVDAVGAGAVPRHADEQAAVVTEVGRPPVLRVGHQRLQVGLQRAVVQPVEGRGVVEARIEGVGARGVLVEQVHAQLVRPPVAVGRRITDDGMVERALRFAFHGSLPVDWRMRESDRLPTIGIA